MLWLHHFLSRFGEEQTNSKLAWEAKDEVMKTWETVRLFCRSPIPESNDWTLLADVTLGLVLGSFRSSHSVQNGQPHHRLGFQAHPVEEEGRFNLRFIIGLGKEKGLEERRQESKKALICLGNKSKRKNSKNHSFSARSSAQTLLWSPYHLPETITSLNY